MVLEIAESFWKLISKMCESTFSMMNNHIYEPKSNGRRNTVRQFQKTSATGIPLIEICN